MWVCEVVPKSTNVEGYDGLGGAGRPDEPVGIVKDMYMVGRRLMCKDKILSRFLSWRKCISNQLTYEEE